ncbi:MAG: nuclear transport factor 2 family protein [Planctomycetota bacterium]
MHRALTSLCLILLPWTGCAAPAPGPTTALPVVGATDAASQRALLASEDPTLEANKTLVFDMWRTLVDARQLDQAERFLAEDYIQHNPLADTGRAALVAYFSSEPPRPIQDAIAWPVVAVLAEGDFVTIVFARERTDSTGNAYTTTWFDLYRVVDGVIVEHWDPAQRP